jgi:hypothetical protein
VWASKHAHELFNSKKLIGESLFALIHPASLKYLKDRYGEKLLSDYETGRRSIVFSYLLNNGLTALTSRVTRVIATNLSGDV